jgi:hypothetical protein
MIQRLGDGLHNSLNRQNLHLPVLYIQYTVDMYHESRLFLDPSFVKNNVLYSSN